MVLIVLYKYRMLDPALFYLTLELCDSNPSQEGLTKKTLVLDMDRTVGWWSSAAATHGLTASLS